MVNEPVALYTPEPEQQGTATISGVDLPTIQETDHISNKIHYGLGTILAMDLNDIRARVTGGGERDLRQKAANTVDLHAISSKAKRMSESPELAAQLASTPTVKANPDYIVESAWANQYLQAFRNDSSPMAKDIAAEIPEEKERVAQLTHELIMTDQAIDNKLSKARARAESQSYLGWGVDFAKSMFPFYSQLKTTGTIGLFGENLEKEANRWRLMPTTQFQQEFGPTFDKMIEDNPQEAVRLLEAMKGMSRDEKFLDNFMGGLDVVTVPGAPALARRLLLGNVLRGSAKDTIKSVARRETPEIAAAKAIGDNTTAAIAGVTDNLEKELAGGSQGYIDKVWNTLTSNFKFYKNEMQQHWGDASRELLTRLQSGFDSTDQSFKALVLERIFAERVPLKLATAEFLKALKDQMMERVPFPKNGMQDFTGYFQDPFTHTFFYEAHFGRTNGELFDNAKQAHAAATRNNIVDPDVRRIGSRYEYVYRIDVPEDLKELRNLAVTLPEAMPNHSMLNSFLTAIRNPADTLSEHQMLNRVTGSYAPNEFFRWFRKQVNDIKDLQGFRKRKLFNDFEDLVKSGQELYDDNGQLGKWYKGAADINDWYLANKGRIAEESEISAYFTFKKMLEVDRMMREIMITTNKMRFGAKDLQFSYWKKSRKKNEEATKIESPWLSVTRIDPSEGFPKDSNASVLMVTQNKVEGKKLNPSMAASLNEAFHQKKIGVFRIFNPYYFELQGFSREGETPFRYVIADHHLFKERELQFNSLPNRGGGHFEHLYDHYAKEAKFIQDKFTGYWHYVGDRTIGAVSVRAMGKEWARVENQKRALIRDNKLDEARALHDTHFPDESFDDYHKKFFKQKGPDGGFIPPKMDLRQDVHIVANNKTVSDLAPEIFKNTRFADKEGNLKVVNGTRSYSDASVSHIQFTGERDVHDLMALDNVGDRQNPVFKFVKAEKIDPLPMMNRGMTNLINNFALDDIKVSAMEAWARQARDLLRDNIARDVEAAPMRVYYEANYNSFKTSADATVVKQMMWNKHKIDTFIGVPSKMDTFLHATAQNIADSMYGKLGPKGAIVPTKMLPYLKDPFRAFRSLVFNEKVGLFSPAQFFVHLTTYSTLLGVAGVGKAVPGTYGAFLHLWAIMNPHILDMLDEKASNSLMRIPGSNSFWKPGEWKEAFNLSRTGFLKSELEHAQQDSVFKNQIVRSQWGNFLDWGRMFFKGGLASVRTAAWYTAYREFRDEFPTKAIGNIERMRLLQRADTLSHQMSRAHSTLLNQGVLSTATQFMTYQQRLIELMMGNSIKGREKMRLLGWNLALFGLPTAAALTPIPGFGDLIKRQAREHGYIVGDNFIASLIGQGGLSTLLALATGRHYNVGDRYGTKGLEWLEETLKGDRTIWETFGGASYQTLLNTVTETDGFWRTMISGAKTVMGIPHENEVYPMTLDIMLKPFREISSVNALYRFMEAIHTANWYSKQGRKLETDVSVPEALFMTLTGLQRQSTEDIFTYAEMRKGEKQYMEQTRRLFFSQMSQYYRNMVNNDPDAAKENFQQAQAILIQRGYPKEEVLHAFQEAWSANEPLAKTIPESFYLKSVPTGRAGSNEADWARFTHQRNKEKGIE